MPKHSAADTSPEVKPITYIFPRIHFEEEWDITKISSLWMLYLYYNISDTLVAFGDKSDFIPRLAESWSFSEDRKTVNFIISDKFYFHDGRKVTPQDVYKSLERVLLMKKTSHSDFSEAVCTEGDKCSGLSLKGNVITLKLKRPLNDFIFSLAIPEYAIVPEDVITGKSKDKDSLRNLTGPYKVTSFTKDQILLKKNEKYNDLYNTSPDTAIIKEINDFDKSMEYLKSHKEAVLISLDYNNILKASKLKGFTKYYGEPTILELIALNPDAQKMQDDSLKRNLFSIMNKLKKDLKIDKSFTVPTRQFFTDTNVATLKESDILKCYDPDVKPLKEKTTVTMLVFEEMKESEIPYELKKSLAKYNVDLKIIIPNDSEIMDVINNNKYDLAYMVTGAGTFEPLVEFTYLLNETKFVGSKNESMKKILAQAKITTDRKEYLKLVKEMHLKMLSDYRLLPLFHVKKIFITGGDYEIINFSHFDGSFEIKKWKRKNIK